MKAKILGTYILFLTDIQKKITAEKKRTYDKIIEEKNTNGKVIEWRMRRPAAVSSQWF